MTEHVETGADHLENGHATYRTVGGETSFVFYFKVYREEDVKLFKDGEPVQDGYTVRFSKDSFGGEVIFDSPLEAGVDMLFVQDFSLKGRRGTFYESGSFPIRLLNEELDMLHGRLQILERFKSRALHAKESESEAFATDGALPLPEAGKLLMGREDHRGWENSRYTHEALETMLRDASRVASALEAVPSVGQIALGFDDMGATVLAKGSRGQQLVVRASSMRFIHSFMEESHHVTLAVKLVRAHDDSVRYTHTFKINVPTKTRGGPYVHTADLGEEHGWTLSVGDVLTLEVSEVMSNKVKGLIVAFA